MSSAHIGTSASMIVYVGIAVVIALLAGVVIGTDPVLGGAAFIALAIGIALVFRPVLALLALVASLVIGQLARVPAFGTEGAVLLNDLIIPALAFGWLLRGFLRKRVEFPSSPLSWPIATMFIVFVLTFILGATQVPFLTNRELLASFLYILRWTEYALLFFIVADVLREEAKAQRIIWSLLAAAGIVAVLGFVQLKIYPDFSFMVPQGWDPHVGRLLSTWFDPNFLAGFFVFAMLVAAAVALHSTKAQRIMLWLLVSVLFAALVLTFSRSGYAGFVAGAAVLTLLYSWRLLVLLVLVVTLVVTNIPRVQERIGGVQSLDETARLRIVSWQNALTVYQDHPITGIGYNTYRYVQVNYGFQKDAAEHSAGGSDSSLLTILVTTGPVGLLVYLWMLWASLAIAWKSFKNGASKFVRGLGLGTFAGTVSVIVHSFFINSLLFPHMMMTIAIVLGMLVGLGQKKPEQNIIQ